MTEREQFEKVRSALEEYTQIPFMSSMGESLNQCCRTLASEGHADDCRGAKALKILGAWQAATSRQQERIRELEEALRDEKGILGKLARFADSCAEASFDGCDIDGGTIQEWMEGEGLLVRRPDLVVPCGEFCSCSESMGEGQQCDSLFLSAEFKQALSATARNDAHDWKLQGSAGVWESYYRCIKCGATVQENTDGPTKPETGCATAQEKQK